MVIIDRVVCNFCYSLLGQLFNTSAQYREGLNDLSVAPHFSVCPDCTPVKGFVVTPALLSDPKLVSL